MLNYTTKGSAREVHKTTLGDVKYGTVFGRRTALRSGHYIIQPLRKHKSHSAILVGSKRRRKVKRGQLDVPRRRPILRVILPRIENTTRDHIITNFFPM